MQLNALSLSHKFMREHVKPGDFCIDATCGHGKDTALLCQLTGPDGRVLAFDIQQEALDSASALLDREGLSGRAELILDSHAHLEAYAEPETVDCIVFNLGWLPGGNHDIHTTADGSIAAIRQGLILLKPMAVMCLCVYYGRNNGYGERDAVLEYVESLDPSQYTAIVSRFVNRRGDVAFPIFLHKQN